MFVCNLSSGGVGFLASQLIPRGRIVELAVPLHDSTLYLGGVRATTLARAGRIEGSRPALARADALFAWSLAPSCPEVF